jgi:hypothetical protein
VIAFVAGHARDPLQQLGVMLQGADVAPGDLVGRVAEVIVLSVWSRVSIVSISAFLKTKAASASSFDLTIWFCNLGLIFGLHIGNFVEPMNASIGKLIKQKRRSKSPT